MNQSKVVVLGGGIAGISACYHGSLNGLDIVCYEANNKPGGLVSNFTIDGFRFDNAVHLSFSKSDYVNKLFLSTDHFKHKPDAYCYENNNWLKHPVQNNLYPLTTKEKVDCIESFVSRPSLEPSNYLEWLQHQYGDVIADRYPVPYTKKYWGLSPERLSLSWVGNRMRRAELNEILAGAIEKKDENHYYAAEMRYPKKGGYYSFIKDIVNESNVVCDHKVEKIDVKNKIIYFANRKSVVYEHLISSLPLPMICELIQNCPKNVLDAARSLLWTTVDLVSVGFNIPKVPPFLWFYIYDDDCLAARAYSPSLKSPDNAPKNKSSLQFEVYNLSTKDRLNEKDLIDNIKLKLLDMKVCKESDIEFLHHKHLPYGNVVFDHGMEERRKIVLDYLQSIDIKSCGRFGEWEYLWSDQSFLSGKEKVNML